MTRLPLRLAFFLICEVAAFANGNEPKPLDQMSPAERETYARLLQEYRAAGAKQESLLQQKKEADPTFARAVYWLENEQLDKSTQYRKLKQAFKATLNADEKDKYNQWLRGYLLSAGRETLNKEWNTVPSARPAILFIAEHQLARSRKPTEGKDVQDTGRNDIPQRAGNGSETWHQFLAWSKRYEEDSVGDWAALGRELHVPKGLQEELHKEVINWALFGVYDTYYHAHSPPELFTLRRQATAYSNELSELRPGWEYAEGLAYPDSPRGRELFQQSQKRGESNDRP